MKRRYLFLLFMAGLVLMNACQKEYSFESGNGPSAGTLQDDGTGDCLPKSVMGAYVAGTALNANNYIEVQVNVTQAGSYVIYTDTVNGMWFRISGVFATTGLNTVQLKGNGTPQAVGIDNFIVHYGNSGCTIAVNVVSTLADFTIDCSGAAVAGTYTAGTPLTSANNVTLNVNVTAIGAYSIITAPSNGMTFSGSGVFTATGPQAIVLTGQNTPAVAGSTTIPVSQGNSTCSFTVNVVSAAPSAVFTVNCGSATINGTYTQNTALVSSTNTVTIGVNVTTVGAYNITATAANMTFTASGTFTAVGAQNITLAGSGTPNSSGAISVPVTGGSASCNITVNVTPAAGAATFTIDCNSATINGTYTAGTALTASNTVILSVNVTAIGTYNITTTSTDGIVFTASGSFAATGAQTVTLTSTSTPTSSGTFNIPVPGNPGCTFSLTVDPGTPTLGTWSFKAGTTTYSGTFFSATLDNTSAPPLTALDAGGDNPATDQFSIGVFDLAGGIQVNEQYNCASLFTNSGFVYFTPAAGTPTYDADPSITSNTMVIKIISHNTSTKTISGTFSGNAIINGSGGGTTPIAITQGMFTVTYQ